MKRLPVLVALLFTLPLASVAIADSIDIHSRTFAPDGSFVDVALTPGVDQFIGGFRLGLGPPAGMTDLGFGEFLTGPVTTLTWTLTLSNLASPLVFDFASILQVCGINPGDNCVVGHGFFVPTTFVPVSGILTVDFNDQMETFNFHYVSNAPEPTTLLLLGTGLAGIGWRKFRATKA